MHQEQRGSANKRGAYLIAIIVLISIGKMVKDNITHLLNSLLACSEFENVIFRWVLHKQKILDDLIARLHLNNCATYNFSLVSSKEVLSERLNYDILAGKRKADIIERSTTRILLYDRLDTIKIDVSAISPASIARRIRDHVSGTHPALQTRKQRA